MGVEVVWTCDKCRATARAADLQVPYCWVINISGTVLCHSCLNRAVSEGVTVVFPPEDDSLNCVECGAFAHAHDIGRDHRFRAPAIMPDTSPDTHGHAIS